MAASMTLKTFLSKTLILSRRPCSLCVRSLHSAATEDGSSKRYNPSHDDEIIIPKKIKRDSLTILKALAETVKKDPTRPRYTVLDDPHVTSYPLNIILKKKYALAKDSGRKTARYMANLYRDAFDHDTAQPRVKAFDPEPLYECTTLCEDALKERIELRKVVHAIEIYKKMEAQGMDIADSTQLSLLELLCVFSEFDPPEKRFQEENLFKRELVDTDVDHILWKSNGLAEKIFENLSDKPDKCYNWMLKGFCKFGESKKAFDLYEEMKAVEVKVDVSGYHGLLLQSAAELPKAEDVFDRIKELWKAMRVADYPPSLEMFNCSLNVLPGSKSKEHATAILAEMAAVGVEPDCETLGQVLRCCHEPDGVEDKRSDDKVTSDHLYIVNDLLNYIDETSVDMNRYDADTFFSIGMEICRFGRNSKLAAKLFNLLETKTLQEIFTQPTQENNFCQNYMLVLLETEDLPTVMNVYEKIVPNLYVPSFFTRRQILQKIRRSKSYEYIPVIWREYMPVFNLCLEICDDMANAECSQELKEEFFQLLDLAFRMKWISKVTAGGRRKPDQTMRWITGEVISHGIKIAVNVDRLETAAKYLMTYYDNRSRINGSVSDGAMDTLVNAFIAKENFFFATELMETIKIWSVLANDDPASLLLNKISKLALVLHPHQLNQIIKPA